MLVVLVLICLCWSNLFKSFGMLWSQCSRKVFDN